MIVLIALAIPTLLGFLILSVLFKNDDSVSLLERLCLSYPIGAGILTLQMFFLGLIRVPLTLYVVSLLVLIEITGFAIWLKRKNITIFPSSMFGLHLELRDPSIPAFKRIALFALFLWVCVKICSIFIETGLRPIFAWDAWANWSATGKLFYFNQGMLLDEVPEYFFGRNTVLRIVGYPLHNPMMQAWLSMWIGSFDDVLAKFWTPMYLVCGATYLYLIASREIGRLLGMAFLAIFMSSPLMSYHAIEVYSDFPLGIYIFLTLAAFLQAMKGKSTYWIVTGILLAISLFVKDEAVFYAVPLLVSSIIYLVKSPQLTASKRRAAFSLFAPLLLVLPWFIFKFYFTPSMGVVSMETKLVFHPENIYKALAIFLTLENFNIIFVSFPIMFALAGKPDKHLLHAAVVIIFALTLFFALYVFIPDYHHHFSVGTIFHRNMLTAYPSLCLLTILLLHKIIPYRPIPSKHIK